MLYLTCYVNHTYLTQTLSHIVPFTSLESQCVLHALWIYTVPNTRLSHSLYTQNWALCTIDRIESLCTLQKLWVTLSYRNFESHCITMYTTQTLSHTVLYTSLESHCTLHKTIYYVSYTLSESHCNLRKPWITLSLTQDLFTMYLTRHLSHTVPYISFESCCTLHKPWVMLYFT